MTASAPTLPSAPAPDLRLESGPLLDILLEDAPAALAILDRDLRGLAASRRWLLDHGMERGTVLGRDPWEDHPELPPRWRETCRRCLAANQPGCLEDPILLPSGALEWLRWKVQPWHRPTGEAGGLVILAERVTALRQAEQSAKETETLFRRVLETLPMPAGLFRRAGATVMVNRAFRDTFGYALAEVPTQAAWRAIAYPGDRARKEADAAWEAIAQRLREVEPPEVQRTTRTVTARDGSRHRMDLTFLVQGDFVLITYLARPRGRR